jgi:hypothetical protein
VQEVFASIPTSRKGQIEFSQLLNAVAGFKELQLDSAVNRLAQDVSKRAEGKKIPVERSGGGT